MNLRDLNLQLKGNTKLPVSTCVKTMEPSACRQILHPAAFPFKEEGFLANHPLSCHPQGVFGNRESGKKMKESKGMGKQRENCRPPSLYYQKSSLYSVWSGGFYSQPIVQFTTNYKNKHYYKEKVGRKPKREQKAKMDSMKEQGRMNSGKSYE